MEENSVDLTTVTSPGVYLESIIEGSNGAKVCKFALRFKQPNSESFAADKIQALHYYLQESLIQNLPDIVSFNPLGSMTGFSLCVLNNDSINSIKTALSESLRNLSDYSEGGETVRHDLGFAKEYAKKLLEQRDNWLSVK